MIKKEKLKGILPAIVPCTTDCTWDNLYQLINSLITLLLEVAIPLAVIVILYGGFMIITSGGSEDGFKKGKDAIIGAVIGLAIVFGSYIAVNLIIGALT